MPSARGPLLPRRRLGAEFRRLRGERTLEEVAEETLISTSKLSRLENGQSAPQQRDVRDLINFYGADRATADRIRRWAAEGRQQAWWKEYSDVLADSVDVYLDYESGASVIRTYAALVLPGLLQTDAYATRLLKIINPRLTHEQIEKLVQLRLHRQELLLDDSEDATRLIAVIDEAAVRRAAAMPGGTGRKQLEHLRTTSMRPNVSLRVLPLEVGLHAGVMGTFTVFQFTDDIDRDVVSIETHSGERLLEEQSSVLEYLRLFDAVIRRAPDNQSSRDLLARYLDAPHPEGERKR